MNTNILTYFEKESTYIDATGRELCSMTKGSLVEMSKIVAAYTDVQGGTYDENEVRLCSSGYESFKTEKELESEPATCLYFKSKSMSTLLVSTSVEDSLENIKALSSYLTE